MSDLTITSVSIGGDVRTFEDPVAQARANAAYELAQEAKQVVDEWEPPEFDVPDTPSTGVQETDPEWVGHLQYRGKNLGSEFTTEQKLAILNGSFEDLYLGDYWEVDNNNYRIADINYWLNTGDQSSKCSDNHLVIVPDKNMRSQVINNASGNSTAGGYAGSTLYKSGMTSVSNTIKNIFGSDNILKHREYFSNAVTDGKSSGGTWVDNEICLMNLVMVVGFNRFDTLHDVGIDHNQLALFKARRDLISATKLDGTTVEQYWLRNVFNAYTYGAIAGQGNIGSGASNDSYGVRPVFGITG